MATLALSLALSIAPAWAKSSNSGSVKIRDASSGQLLSDSSNDPHVCTFVVVFDYDPATSGTWHILSWAPTGDGSQVAGGTWSAVGPSQTDVMTLDPGHYRLDYQADGANSKNKTFWVDDCATSGGSAGGNSPEASASDSPSDPPSDSPSDSPTDSPSDPPSDSPADSPSDPPSDSPADSPSDLPSDQQGNNGSGNQDPEGGVQGATGGDQNGSGSQPSDQPGNGGPQSGNAAPSSQPSDQAGGTRGVTSAAGDGNPSLPDTATTPPSVLSPLLAAIGLLLIIAAHPFIRRSALADRA